jgi:hypothetical protein
MGSVTILLLCIAAVAVSTAPPSKPNFVYFLVDGEFSSHTLLFSLPSLLPSVSP